MLSAHAFHIDILVPKLLMSVTDSLSWQVAFSVLTDHPKPPAGLFNDLPKRINLSCSDTDSKTTIPRLATVSSPTDLPQIRKKLNQSSNDSSEKAAMDKPRFYKSDLMLILEERNRWKEEASALQEELNEWKRF